MPGIEPAIADVVARRDERPIVLVDGRNVQRSKWPNLSDEELVTRCCRWARREGLPTVIVFDGRTPAASDGEECVVVPVLGETADDWLIRATGELREHDVPFWLVTSDRELRARAGRGAERLIGGGTYLKEIGGR